MKILLANLILESFGGSEMWTYTMAQTLKKMGHEVELFSLNMGTFAHKYLADFRLYDVAPTYPYDLQIINQNWCLDALKENPGYKIANSHSYFLEVERFHRGANQYVSVSEEIKDIEAKRGFESVVIGNAIDCERFSPTKPIHDKLTKVLYLTKDNTDVFPKIKEACDELDIEVITPDKPVFNIQDYINDVDCVIGIGRGLLEAMACGRNVVSADYRFWMQGFFGAGLITPDNYDKAKYAMFSGRNMRIQMTKDEIKKQLLLYKPEYGEFLRNKMLEEYEAVKVADRYLSLYG